MRIATSLRVLFHDSRHATSLLKHLGMKSPGSLVLGTPHPRLGTDWWMDFFAVHINFQSSDPVRVSALLSTQSYVGRPVDDWWAAETLFSHEGKAYTRSSVVRTMTDQDGGAHVDSTLEDFYESLIRHSEGLSITTEFERLGAAPFRDGVPQYARNVHLALMRQLAHEVLTTAVHQAWPIEERPIIPWVRYPTAADTHSAPTPNGPHV
ncbi:hypothetical protein [Nocardia salmonicida]|uniref:hypothetical protein n=1 Tax=Nocardia salmonicida TaxID=53431 RepID=UPI0037A94D72